MGVRLRANRMFDPGIPLVVVTPVIEMLARARSRGALVGACLTEGWDAKEGMGTGGGVLVAGLVAGDFSATGA
jgi:hypothetical protein